MYSIHVLGCSNRKLVISKVNINKVNFNTVNLRCHIGASLFHSSWDVNVLICVVGINGGDDDRTDLMSFGEITNEGPPLSVFMYMSAK